VKAQILHLAKELNLVRYEVRNCRETKMKVKMESSAVKSVTLPNFDGTMKKVQVWWTRFIDYANAFGFILALKIGGSSEEVVVDENTDIGKNQMAAKKRNDIAAANLTMAFTTDGTMALDFPKLFQATGQASGMAHVIVLAALLKKYQPQDTMIRVE
jgi:hypothetical protein